jgi:hypothetical protein
MTASMDATIVFSIFYWRLLAGQEDLNLILKLGDGKKVQRNDEDSATGLPLARLNLTTRSTSTMAIRRAWYWRTRICVSLHSW